MEHLVGFFSAALISVLVTAIHYESMALLARTNAESRGRQRVLFVMLGLLAAHVIEIWVFGLAYFAMTKLGLGTITIAASASDVTIFDPFDFIYYSATVYTTLGFGDLVPDGPMRFVTGAEALVGLCLITWSASFTFLEMERHWPNRRH